jgi:hypothetical protein
LRGNAPLSRLFYSDECMGKLPPKTAQDRSRRAWTGAQLARTRVSRMPPALAVLGCQLHTGGSVARPWVPRRRAHGAGQCETAPSSDVADEGPSCSLRISSSPGARLHRVHADDANRARAEVSVADGVLDLPSDVAGTGIEISQMARCPPGGLRASATVHRPVPVSRHRMVRRHGLRVESVTERPWLVWMPRLHHRRRVVRASGRRTASRLMWGDGRWSCCVSRRVRTRGRSCRQLRTR